MGRHFRPYIEWEDYHAGMWANVTPKERTELVTQARDLLGSPRELRTAMTYVVLNWPVASMVNLTDRAGNRRAWIGQAACCAVVGAPEDVTREAWGLLSDIERARANRMADKVIAYWESGIGCQRDFFLKTS